MDEEVAKAIQEAMSIFQINEPPVPSLDIIPTPAHAEKEPGEEPEAAEAAAEEEEPPLVTEPESNPVPSRKRNRFVIAALVAAVISLTLVAMLVLAPLLKPTAAITIIPSGITVATTASVQVAGRPLSTVTLTQARTVRATGTGHQDAQAAYGAVTFYNAAPFVQTVAAGTLLTGGDGVQVVTSQDAVIPAAVMPTEGRAIIAAHAIQTGAAGNIKAGDIYGVCCRDNVFVANGTFTGGQDARSFPMVTQGDLDNAVNSLKIVIRQSANAAFRAQIYQGEASAQPDCTTRTFSDHRAGEEAIQVSSTITATCTAQAYLVQDVQTQTMQNLAADARRQSGDGYGITGDPHITVTGASASGSALRLQVKAQATMVYQFSQGQLQVIKDRIAGMDTAQATTWLVRQPGVKAVSIEVSGTGATLPQDTNAIRCTLLYGV